MNIIYLDHAATTYLDELVLAKMLPFLTEKYGNPSALYTLGREAKKAITIAREKVATCLNCSSNEIVFVGSGTESDNLAIIGTAWANQNKGKHIITSNAEHHAVMHACRFLETQGFKVTYLPVDKNGLISPELVSSAFTKDTILVSIVFANNEVGTINPVREIAAECKKHEVLMHTDACQAAGFFELDVQKLGVDLLTLNSNKIYGPKGAGVLFIRKQTKVSPIIHGGAQEFSLRAGTENVANIIGLAEALTLVQADRVSESQRLTKLRDKLIYELLLRIPRSRLNGHATARLPNNVNISFLDVEGESILLHLDAVGICASTGSACSSASLDPSHVLVALGLPPEIAHGSVRFSLGKRTTEMEIDYVIKILPGIIEKLRKMSPLHTKIEDYQDLFASN